MSKYKIGQQIHFTENVPITTFITEKELIIKKGDKGFIDSSGHIHVTTGEGRGKIIPFLKEELKDYDHKNIAKMIYQRLNGEFHLGEIIEDYDIEKDDVIDIIEDVLIEIL